MKFEYMNMWKTNQEKEMLLKKGNALQDKKLSNFLRMLNVSIPNKSFDVINSYALLLIDQKRNLIEAGLNFALSVLRAAEEAKPHVITLEL